MRRASWTPLPDLFDVNWAEEDLEQVTRTALKKYNAEIHSQTTIEAALQLKREHEIRPRRDRSY